MISLTTNTSQREELKDITSLIEQVLIQNNWQNGVLIVFSPHTTAGITLNEGADPTVSRDILTSLKRLIPKQGDYLHLEGNSDAHLKTSLIGSSVQIIVENGSLSLGTWQKVFLAEFDGPRKRKIWLKFLSA